MSALSKKYIVYVKVSSHLKVQHSTAYVIASLQHTVMMLHVYVPKMAATHIGPNPSSSY